MDISFGVPRVQSEQSGSISGGRRSGGSARNWSYFSRNQREEGVRGIEPSSGITFSPHGIRFDCFPTISRIFCSESQRRRLSKVHTSRYLLNLQADRKAATLWAAGGRHNRQSCTSRRRSKTTTRHQADISATRRPVPKLQSRSRGSI